MPQSEFGGLSADNPPIDQYTLLPSANVARVGKERLVGGERDGSQGSSDLPTPADSHVVYDPTDTLT